MAQLKVSRKYTGKGRTQKLRSQEEEGEEGRAAKSNNRGRGVGKRPVAMGELQANSKRAVSADPPTAGMGYSTSTRRSCGTPNGNEAHEGITSSPSHLFSLSSIYGEGVTAETPHTYTFPGFAQTSHQRTQKKLSHHPKM